MAVRRPFVRMGSYKYPFFFSLALVAVLIAWILFSSFRGTHSAGVPVVAPPAGIASPGGSPVQQLDQQIVAIGAHSLTVSWQSAAVFGVATSTYSIDANTRVYNEIPKNTATLTKEQIAFREQLLATGVPTPAPLTYTLGPAKVSDLKIGMHVSIEYAANSSLARRIMIVSGMTPTPSLPAE